MKNKIISFYLKHRIIITIAIGLGTFFNTILIMFGVATGYIQRSRTLQNQDTIQNGITLQIENDSVQKKKLDSVLQNAKLLNKLTQK